MAWNKLVPFDDKGNMMTYAEGNSGYYAPKEWRPAEKFSAKLTYCGCYRGRSAAVFTFEDENGHTYPFFMGGFDAIIKHMVNGVVTGIFQPVKRGANYGIEKVG